MSFNEWLYERLVSEGIIDSDEYDENDLLTEEDVLAIDEIDLDHDELETYAHSYREFCSDNNYTPDFEGFEDLG